MNRTPRRPPRIEPPLRGQSSSEQVSPRPATVVPPRPPIGEAFSTSKGCKYDNISPELEKIFDRLIILEKKSSRLLKLLKRLFP